MDIHLLKATTGLLSGLIVNTSQPVMLSGGVFQSELQPDMQANLQQPLRTGIDMNVQTIPERPMMQIQVPRHDRQLAAIGVRFWNDGTIYFIDPNSDVYGKVQPGDCLLTEDGINAWVAMKKKLNFGPAGTQVILTIKTNQGIITLPCIRHDVSWFTAQFQRDLMSQY